MAHCLTGSDLSAHLFHFGLHVSVLPEGHFGWEPSAQGVFGFTPPGQTFSSLEHRLNSRSATAAGELAAVEESLHPGGNLLLRPVARKDLLHQGLRFRCHSFSGASTQLLEILVGRCLVHSRGQHLRHQLLLFSCHSCCSYTSIE